MSFKNVYYKRTAGTPKTCYACYKLTTTVLATIDTVDFLYTCPGHLEDRGFASILEPVDGVGGLKKIEVTEEEIVKVKAEWEEKRKKKLEKEKAEGKETKTDGDGSKTDSQGSSTSPHTAQTAPPLPAPAHQRYALHQDFFAMRQAEHRKRRQAAQAKALAPRLPGAPSGNVENKY